MPRRTLGHPVVRNIGVSGLGAVIPAGIGALAAGIAGLSGAGRPVVSLFLAWTVVGYLSLTDLGLSRTSTRLVARDGLRPHDVVAALWRPSAVVGGVLLVGVLGVVVLGGAHPALLLLAVVPPSAALQFPVAGALEGTGRFRALALQRFLNALCVYLVPAVLVSWGQSSAALWCAMVVLVGYRTCSVLILLRLLGVAPASAARSAFRGEHRVATRGVLTWLAISSVLGPLMLYADRFALGWSRVPGEVWVFYVAVSEMLIKTYVLPAAVLAVLFPWFARQRDRWADLAPRVFNRRVPSAAVLLSAVVGAAGMVLPLPHLASMTLGQTRAVVVLLGAGTALSWCSQLYIAVLQAHDRQRLVVLLQAALALPFVGALALVPLAPVPALAAAAAWSGRVGATFVALAVATARSGRNDTTVPTLEPVE